MQDVASFALRYTSTSEAASDILINVKFLIFITICIKISKKTVDEEFCLI